MADELGAVRRTPRPTGDRQTPETGPQESAGTTNTASPVSGDQPAVSSRVSSQVLAIYRSPRSDALAIEREDGEFTCVERHPDGGWRGTGLIEVVPDDWVLARYQPGPECDMEAYAALPPCTACEGTGKDDHATPFEAPLAVHFAGPPVRAEGRRRQLCMWCGHVLADLPNRKDKPLPESWESGVLVRIEDGDATVVPYDGGELPPGCCALPDDEQYARTASSGPTTQGIPDETESTLDGCICTENRCDYDDHDNPPTDWLCVPCGQLTEGTPCLALDGPDDEPADDGLCERCPGLAVEQLSFPGQRLCQQHLNQAFIAEAAAEDQAEDDGPDEDDEQVSGHVESETWHWRNGGYQTATCGKHVPDTSSNRCLLRAGHTDDCSDEFEVPPCTCGPDRCHRLDVNGQCQHCARIGPGQGGCPAANGRGWTLGDHPADRPPDDGPDEAQETRAADWPAEEADRG